MNIAIVGFDIEGRASYEFFQGKGHTLTICDQNQEVAIPDDVQSVLGSPYLDNLDRFDLIVRTAGISPQKILAKNPNVSQKITSHCNEFFKASPTKNIIGVTGTKGKGTTSTLIKNMLSAAGIDVRLGGNIGTPPLTFLEDLTAESWVVLELSSFQLIDLHFSPHIGVCLMVVPEHLNWHTNVEEYYHSKSQLFANQSREDIAIYYGENAESLNIAREGQGKKISFCSSGSEGAWVSKDSGDIIIQDQKVGNVHSLGLLGEHNWQNVCAAVTAAWQVTQDISAISQVLTSFKGLPHRLSRVGEINGVTFYDDSFGTTPETAIVALRSFSQPKVLILGGSDKRANYDLLSEAITHTNVKHVILIGQQADHIQAALERTGYKNFVSGGDSMESAVQTSLQVADDGDVVLLSPACASFDMFKDYKDRGEKFTQAVQALSITS